MIIMVHRYTAPIYIEDGRDILYSCVSRFVRSQIVYNMVIGCVTKITTPDSFSNYFGKSNIF